MQGMIYLIENQINGKRYIGQTRQKRLSYRLKDHFKKSVDTAISHAIRKYGQESFNYVILDCGEMTQEQLDDLEIAYIAAYDSRTPNGYNNTAGGFGGGSRPNKIEDSEKPTILKMYRDGKTTLELSEMYNVSASTMQRYLRIWGVLKNISQCQQKIHDDDLEFVVELYQKLNSTVLVGKELGVSDNSVRRFLIKHGIALTGRGKHQLGKVRGKIKSSPKSRKI